jgi:ABC-type Fe3+/spermidine/putrescine transport system ATPase subunit
MAIPRAAREPVFHARGLKKNYESAGGQVAALRGVDLDLFPGEFVVILGPSGSGKSTLLNILEGLDSASEGEVYYRDHNLVQADPDELTRFRREHVGFVFQFYNLISSLTAEENVPIEVRRIARQRVIPVGALVRDGEGWMVWQIRDGRAQATPVKVWAISGGLAAITSGPKESESVIMYPGDLIHEKMRVTQFAVGR